MSKRRRISLILLAAGLATPCILAIAYCVWRPSPPETGPRIGLSMASSFVIQRPLYEDALARAGGQTILITPTQDDDQLSALLDDVDALLLTGGGDVDPEVYGGESDSGVLIDRQRDEFEIRLIHAALDRDMPILGICRGIQILNVAHEGTIRNLREDEALSEHHGIDLDSFSAHDIEVAEDTRLATVIGAGRYRVNSFHGQAVGLVGSGLRVCATADDGVVEAIERPDRTFAIAIQWHPEITSLTDEAALALFEALVRQAEAYRANSTLKSAAAP